MSFDLLRPRRALALVLVAAAVLAAAIAVPASAHEGKATTTVVQEGTGRFKTVFVWETRDVYETQVVYEWRWGWYYVQVPNMVTVRVKVPVTRCWTSARPGPFGAVGCFTWDTWQNREVQEGTKSVRRWGMKPFKTGTKQVKTGTERVRVPKRVEITRSKTVTNIAHDDGCTWPSQPSQHSTAPANHRATSVYYDDHGHNCVTYRSTEPRIPSLSEIAASVVSGLASVSKTALNLLCQNPVQFIVGNGAGAVAGAAGKELAVKAGAQAVARFAAAGVGASAGAAAVVVACYATGGWRNPDDTPDATPEATAAPTQTPTAAPTAKPEPAPAPRPFEPDRDCYRFYRGVCYNIKDGRVVIFYPPNE
jgi:hypothetical protein